MTVSVQTFNQEERQCMIAIIAHWIQIIKYILVCKYCIYWKEEEEDKLKRWEWNKHSVEVNDRTLIPPEPHTHTDTERWESTVREKSLTDEPVFTTRI